MTRFTVAPIVLFVLVTVSAAADLDWAKLKLPSNDRETFDESMIPKAINSQVGRSISIRGYMIVSSVSSTTGIQRFGMWAETKQKPVNVNAWRKLPLHYIVVVEMVGDSKTEFVLNSPIEVVGTLTIDVLRSTDGAVTTVYKIQATSVSRAEKRDGYHCAAAHGC